MSKLVHLRNNTTFYVTNDQAEGIFNAMNENPNLRILRIITGQGYRYINPSAIVDMTPGFGEDYRSDEQLLKEQESALRSIGGRKALTGTGSIGIGAGNEGA